MERARKASDEEQNNVDRLSALPDGIICHVLSFLPTQDSVQTSVLAKRWRFLWAHVPVLKFDCGFRSPESNTFSGTVCAILLRHKAQSLNTFRLTYEGGTNGYNTYELQTCIATVVERNVQNLHLQQLRVELPRCLFTCKTLVDLTLFEYVSIPASAPTSLPNLKNLRLWDLDCKVDFTRLLSGCPVLEDLRIGGTKCRDPGGCYISSPTLKRLSITQFLDRSMLDNPDYVVTINTPVLRYLAVLDHSIKPFYISPCTSLVNADIIMGSWGEPDDFCHRWVLKLLDSVRNAKSLKFSCSCDEICDGSMPGSVVKFDNLTELDLRAPWCTLTKFLETANHLQVLTIIEGRRHSRHWLDPVEERSAHVLNSLKTVSIDDFRCTEQGFNMVRYILKNAQVLERMVMKSSHADWKQKFDAIRRISIFPRESKKCEIHFS